MSGTFELDISKFVEKAKGNVDQVIRRAALDIFRRVVIKSPVDTGRFKSNWQVAINSVPTGLAPGSEPGKEKYNTEVAFERINTGLLLAKSGDVLWLVNNLSYARRLEYGWSDQAPKGMVRLTILEWNNAVSKAAQSMR